MEEQHLAHLDGWRGLAILMVLVSHFGPHVPADIGRFGVDLFFVLSGLLMSWILFEKRTPVGTFYRRRIARILPAFFLFVVLIVTVFDFAGHLTSKSELVELLTFTRTYGNPPIWHSAAPVGHLWSLNVEEHCYIILATIASLAATRKRAWLICGLLTPLTIAAILLHFHFDHDSSYEWMLKTECAATGLLASVAIRARFGRRLPGWFAPIGLLAALPCYIDGAHWWEQAIIAPILLALAVNSVGHSTYLRKVLEFKPLCVLGLISYSVYLWQQPFYKFPPPDHLGVLCALLIGAGSFYLYESPVRRWLNAHWVSASQLIQAH